MPYHPISSVNAIAYRLDIYNHSLERIMILDMPAIRSLSFEIKLSDIAVCTFAMSGDDSRALLIQRDYMVEVLRYNGSAWRSQHTYLIKLFETITEEDNERIILFGGVSLEYLLAARIIDPDDDPLVANGYSTKSGAAQTVMLEYVKQQMGIDTSVARQFGVVMGDDFGLGYQVGRRLRHENLLEVLQELTLVGQLDFRLVLDDGELTFIVNNFGTDRSRRANHQSWMMFSKLRGNVVNPHFSQDYRDVYNFGYVLGPGQGENRAVYKLPVTDAFATPFARREMIVDAGQTDVGTSLQALSEGYAKLYEARRKLSFTFELKQMKNSRYEIDWFLGDTVTARDDSGQEFTMRFLEVAVTLDENKQEDITPRLVEWVQ